MKRLSAIPIILCASQPVFAQNTNNNAITQAEDAFGASVGNERIGIYSGDEVRGFSPNEAGNNRIEGLFVDNGGNVSPRLVQGSTIRVGYAARGTPFPAPTGIVDTRIEKFTGTRQISAEMEVETYRNIVGAIEAKLPISGEKFGLSLGAGFRHASQINNLRAGNFASWLASASWLPAKGSEIIVFTSGYHGSQARPIPSFFPSGAAPPPVQPRKLVQAQPWARNINGGSLSGMIAKLPIGSLKLEAGLFRSTRNEPRSFIHLFQNVTPSGAANLVILADGNNESAAWSGEVRLSKVWTGENLRHTLTASLRGRSQDRLFGGQQRLALGSVQTGIEDFRTQPVITLGPEDQSHVRQLIGGLQYGLQTKTGATFSAAIQKATYRREADFVDPTRTDALTHDAPWLFSFNGSLPLFHGLTLYGGYVRGMEESALAPDIATNRNDAPPALITRQMDAGLRYAINPHLSIIAGVFDIQKPFYGLDGRSLFTNLGTVSNRGIEVSVTGTLTKGLTIVAGGIVVDPKISGAAVVAKDIAPRPLGTFKQRGIINLDWKPLNQQAWSFDMAFEHISGEYAVFRQVTGGITQPLIPFETNGRTTLNVGARYRFKMSNSTILLRGQVQNLFDNYAWRVSNSGGFTFSSPRTALLSAVADF